MTAEDSSSSDRSMLQSTVIHQDDEGERSHLLKVRLNNASDVNRTVLDSSHALHGITHI